MSVDELDIDLYPVEDADRGLWAVGPSPDEIAADAALALLEESEADVEALFAAQHTDRKAACVDIFDQVVDQLRHISLVRNAAWKQASSAHYKPRPAGILDFRSDVALAAKRVLSAYDYTYFTKVWMDDEWPEKIVPPVALKRIRVAVGSAWKRAGLAHYFNTPPKGKA
jgi:hypothetical protein